MVVFVLEDDLSLDFLEEEEGVGAAVVDTSGT